MTSYTIKIAVDPPGLVPTGGSLGNFVFTPALLHVEPGDSVTWICDNPFVLEFKQGPPIEQTQVAGCQLPAGGFASPAYPIRDVKGQFHYAVAVWTGARVFMDAACAGLSVN